MRKVVFTEKAMIKKVRLYAILYNIILDNRFTSKRCLVCCQSLSLFFIRSIYLQGYLTLKKTRVNTQEKTTISGDDGVNQGEDVIYRQPKASLLGAPPSSALNQAGIKNSKCIHYIGISNR